MKQRILSLLVLLAAAVSGAWAKVPTFDQTIFESDAQLGQIYVTEDTEITIASGKTVTITGGLIIEDNATLTVNGPGTLVVNGANISGSGQQGSNGSTGGQGGQGTQGGAAISGNIIIKGATVNATGGSGGKGGIGGNGMNGSGGQGGKGGQGGAAFDGAVTIFSGTITAKGGSGGGGGEGGIGMNPTSPGMIQGDQGPGGDSGYAFAGTLTFYGGTVNTIGSMTGYGKPNGNASNAFVNPVTMNAATYELKGGYYSASDEIELANIVNYRYVSITAADYVESTFDYELTVEASDHGSGTISYTVQDKDDAEKITENAKGANEGDKVTVTITPDEGWRVDDTKNSHGDVTALLYRYWEGSRRAQAMVPMQRTVDLKYEDEYDGVFTYSFTMPASNVKVKAEYLKVSTLYFDPAEKTNLMEVNVDYIVRNVEDSKTFKIEKVEKVTEGAPVKLTANTGYKFRKVEVKKGSAAKTITIGDMELKYADGDKWETIVSKNSDKIKTLAGGYIVQVAQPAPNQYRYLNVLSTKVNPSDFIDPSKNYQWSTLEVYF